MVALAELEPGALVLEVGPGLGALSLGILEAGAHLIAIERDVMFKPILASVLEDRAELHWGDAMRIDIRRLLRGRPAVVVANLPYQIATPLVLDLLVEAPSITAFTIMVQREAGERLAALPGSEPYGAVSAKVAYLATARVAARVSRRVFYPMPEVESVIVRIDRRARPGVSGGRDRIFAVIEAGFAQRRKTIRRALRNIWSLDEVEHALARTRIAGEVRAETLGIAEFASLARALPVKR